MGKICFGKPKKWGCMPKNDNIKTSYDNVNVNVNWYLIDN